MLDVKLIREQPELVREAMRKRYQDPAPVDQVLKFDNERRTIIQDVEAKRSERNKVSKEISRMKEQAERESKIEAMRLLGAEISALDEKLKQVEAKLLAAASIIPNIPDADVPIGEDDKDNVVIRTVGEQPAFDFAPQAHWDIGPALGIIDFEGGVKLAGSRFYVLSGAGARLQRALIFWMLDLHTRQGYLEK